MVYGIETDQGPFYIPEHVAEILERETRIAKRCAWRMFWRGYTAGILVSGALLIPALVLLT